MKFWDGFITPTILFRVMKKELLGKYEVVKRSPAHDSVNAPKMKANKPAQKKPEDTKPKKDSAASDESKS